MTVPPAFSVNLWGNLYVMGLPLPTCLFTCQFPKHWSCKNNHRYLFVAVKTVNHKLKPTQLVAFGPILACQSSQVEIRLFTIVINTYSKYTISPICNWTQWIHGLTHHVQQLFWTISIVTLCPTVKSCNYNTRLRKKKDLIQKVVNLCVHLLKESRKGQRVDCAMNASLTDRPGLNGHQQKNK